MVKQEKNSNSYTITDPALEPYYIQYDQYCYTAVKKIKAGTSDRVRDSILGYYSDLPRCLDSIAKDSAKTQDYPTLGEFINKQATKLQELKQNILQ